MDPQYSPHAAFDDVVAIVSDPPESVDLELAERGLDVIATWMSDEEVNAVANFIDLMRRQEHISADVYTQTTDALDRAYQTIYGMDSAEDSNSLTH